MRLRDMLETIGHSYDQHLPLDSAPQRLLRNAAREFRQWLPAGYIAEGSGGKGRPAVCPWIAVFDPDETTTARRGMYLAYLFAADLQTIALTLLHGGEDLHERHGAAAAEMLKRQASAIRDRLVKDETSDLETAISLGSNLRRPRLYEHGTILARSYPTRHLPSEDALVSDLHRFLRLYAIALRAREQARQAGAKEIVTPAAETHPATLRAIEFKPKNDSEYRQMIMGREIVKSRKHETLVREYGEFLQTRGFVVGTPHPRDLVAERDGRHWLIEAKIVYAGDGESAARQALSQLMFYARFLYPSGTTVNKVALYSEKVGDLYTSFFEELGIASVWRDGNGWDGSTSAHDAKLC